VHVLISTYGLVSVAPAPRRAALNMAKPAVRRCCTDRTCDACKRASEDIIQAAIANVARRDKALGFSRGAPYYLQSSRGLCPGLWLLTSGDWGSDLKRRASFATISAALDARDTWTAPDRRSAMIEEVAVMGTAVPLRVAA
jgi:hypothetical protein